MRIAPGVRNKANSNLSVEKMLRTLAKTLGLEEGEPEMLTNGSQGSFVNVGTPRATEGQGENVSDSDDEAQGESEAQPTKDTALPTPDPEPTCRAKHAKPGRARLTTGVIAAEAAAQAEAVEVKKTVDETATSVDASTPLYATVAQVDVAAPAAVEAAVEATVAIEVPTDAPAAVETVVEASTDAEVAANADLRTR